MSKKLLVKCSSTFGIIPLILLSSYIEARAWLDTGDMKLRHELQLLSDAGLLDVPLTTWPLVSKDIYNNLKQPASDTPLKPELLGVLNNINKRLKADNFGSDFVVKGEARSKKLLIRDFSGEGRENASVSYDRQWESSAVDLRLKASIADKSKHPNDQSFRLDESYISGDLSKWKLTAGMQSRWWGPSWDGSLILSNNARPIPSLSVENITSEGFDNKYLKWIGPNKVHMFIGKLESKRGVPDTKLIGTRITFKPHKSFEVGLHRTIQWGGEGQGNSFSSLLKTVAGLNSNTPHDRIGGNSIAGLDIRWNIPATSDKRNYSLYSQYIGEDRAANSILLGDETFLFGGSVSGFSSELKGSWRAYLETVDTSAASFKGRDRNNIIYNHGTYTDGYRYQDVSLGHGIDSDSRLVSAGVMLSQKNGNFWRGWVKHGKLNVDGVGNNPIAPNGKKWTAVGVSLDKTLSKQTSLNLGLQYISDKEIEGETDNDLAVSIGFTHTFK